MFPHDLLNMHVAELQEAQVMHFYYFMHMGLSCSVIGLHVCEFVGFVGIACKRERVLWLGKMIILGWVSVFLI